MIKKSNILLLSRTWRIDYRMTRVCKLIWQQAASLPRSQSVGTSRCQRQDSWKTGRQWTGNSRHHPDKVPLREETSGLPSNTCFLAPTRVHVQNGISIGSAVFAQVTRVPTHRQIDTPTSLLLIFRNWKVSDRDHAHLRTLCHPKAKSSHGQPFQRYLEGLKFKMGHVTWPRPFQGCLSYVGWDLLRPTCTPNLKLQRVICRKWQILSYPTCIWRPVGGDLLRISSISLASKN